MPRIVLAFAATDLLENFRAQPVYAVYDVRTMILDQAHPAAIVYRQAKLMINHIIDRSRNAITMGVRA